MGAGLTRMVGECHAVSGRTSRLSKLAIRIHVPRKMAEDLTFGLLERLHDVQNDGISYYMVISQQSRLLMVQTVGLDA